MPRDLSDDMACLVCAQERIILLVGYQITLCLFNWNKHVWMHNYFYFEALCLVKSAHVTVFAHRFLHNDSSIDIQTDDT